MMVHFAGRQPPIAFQSEGRGHLLNDFMKGLGHFTVNVLPQRSLLWLAQRELDELDTEDVIHSEACSELTGGVLVATPVSK